MSYVIGDDSINLSNDIMDYEKKYKEALERAKNTIEVNQTIPDIIECVESLFPELRESEDERIRKEIIRFIFNYPQKLTNRDSWLAWLEKQGEKHIDRELSNLLNRVICRFINDPNIPYSERDEVSKKIIPYVKQLEKQCEQKSAWSEEDEKAINDIMWIIEAYRKNGFNETHIQMADSSENWLKSLRPQNKWKPSDEQLCALEHATMYNTLNANDAANLAILYNDLKKLKG